MVAADEELAAQIPLELLDRPADRGDRQMDALGCAGEVELLRDSDEALQTREIHEAMVRCATR
jgi:hypothetical protein